MIRSFIFVLTFMWTLSTFGEESAPGDQVLNLKTEEAKAMFLLPGGTETCNGVLVHVANKSLKPDPRWTEIARSVGFAHMVMKIDMKRNNRPRRLRNSVNPLLKQAADQLDRPELEGAFVAPTGHSAGGMGASAFAPLQDQLVTAANDCSWVYKPEKRPEMKTVPMLFVIGSIPDDFKMLDAIPKTYDPARAQGAVWALSLEWGKAHSFGNAGTLFAAWFQSVIPMRVEAVGKPLKEVKLEGGWLGDRRSWDTPHPVIAPYEKYAGDKSKAVWLPDRAFAYVWRAYQAKGSPVQLSAHVMGTEKRLKPYKPSSAHQLKLSAGSSLQLGLDIREEVEIRKVTFYEKDNVIAVADSAPWQVEVKLPDADAKVVFAEAELADGTTVYTQPALLIIQPSRSEWWSTAGGAASCGGNLCRTCRILRRSF